MKMRKLPENLNKFETTFFLNASLTPTFSTTVLHYLLTYVPVPVCTMIHKGRILSCTNIPVVYFYRYIFTLYSQKEIFGRIRTLKMSFMANLYKVLTPKSVHCIASLGLKLATRFRQVGTSTAITLGI